MEPTAGLRPEVWLSPALVTPTQNYKIYDKKQYTNDSSRRSKLYRTQYVGVGI
jgi:hypothetical protein